MCGICGFISKKPEKLETLVKMNNTISHRGPDDNGEEIYHVGSDWYVGFAQRRLSIIDLSLKGHQPMHSVDKRVSIVFNGEIYNYKDIKNNIKDYPFVSDSDTEVLIAAYLKWGISFVDKINGMFAMAILDRREETIYLIRDRIGKKPLYYYCKNGDIVFGSELKAVRESSLFEQEIDYGVIGEYLYRAYINAPKTIYQNTYKLEPGCILKIKNGKCENYKYWDVSEKNKEIRINKITDYEYAKSELKTLLRKSVKRRMVSDVPLGTFLSGGYDSTLVCALAQEISDKPLKTFSIGFYDEKYNEAKYAKQIAEYLGTDHTELYFTEQDMLELVDDIPMYYDEPFADSSQIPTMLVSRLAKGQVSVALTGDGGDELFGGYDIYTIMQKAEANKLKGRVLHMLSYIPNFKESSIWKNRNLVDKIVSEDISLDIRTQAGIKGYITSINSLLNYEPDNYFFPFETKYDEKRYDITRMLLDLDTYLPGDILAKVDRASMRYALECRCPMLDTDVMEFSFKLPPEYKDNNGNQKRILKDITYELVPKEIMDRPKKGFSIPVNKWLRNELKEKVYSMADYDFLKTQGIFKPKEMRSFIDYFMENGNQPGRSYASRVWAFYVFQMWYKRYAM